jgi:hypothetical protein
MIAVAGQGFGKDRKAEGHELLIMKRQAAGMIFNDC